jgi:hypothetical protein
MPPRFVRNSSHPCAAREESARLPCWKLFRFARNDRRSELNRSDLMGKRSDPVTAVVTSPNEIKLPAA